VPDEAKSSYWAVAWHSGDLNVACFPQQAFEDLREHVEEEAVRKAGKLRQQGKK
jgi:hypothetical protein